MINFPVFDRLDVDGYEMYPGTRSSPGLSVDFRGGTTLILGANGLGKTTLITILFRACVGPTEIRNVAPRGSLGSRRQNRDLRVLNRGERRLFAARVLDDAASASSTLAMTLGDTRITARRSLHNLELLELDRDGEVLEPREAEYQRLIVESAGLARFSDWILLLRFITFYFEDRRALVWDPSAQRQILRMLFLPPKDSSRWSDLEGDVLQRDSNVRNLQASLTMAERQMLSSEAAVAASPELRGQLRHLQREQEQQQAELDGQNEQLVRLEAEQQTARLNAVRADLEREAAYRDLERRQLLSIRALFPSRDETARYLISKLFSDGHCLTCGNDAPDAVARMTKELSADRCLICGSPLVADDGATFSFSSRSLRTAENALARAEIRRRTAADERAAAEASFATAVASVRRLRAEVAARSATIDSLVSRLPPDEAELHAARDELSAIRGRVEDMKEELAQSRATFTTFIRSVIRRIAKRAEDVQATFSEFAHGFLLEDCSLAYQPHKDKVGQTGQQISFPAFELDMTGASFTSKVRRSGPEQVSESQREFIDLAFRMTLMTEAGAGGTGSLVIDAPESSLDAVFVTRAADVLTRFADYTSTNRLVLTSNLVEGDLIPELLRQSQITSQRDHRVVDLLRLAAPTAATRQLAKEYKEVRANLFRRAAEDK